jgi:hypothetical protein
MPVLVHAYLGNALTGAFQSGVGCYTFLSCCTQNPSGISNYVDLTAETEDPAAIRQAEAYLAFPILDAGVPEAHIVSHSDVERRCTEQLQNVFGSASMCLPFRPLR